MLHLQYIYKGYMDLSVRSTPVLSSIDTVHIFLSNVGFNSVKPKNFVVF